MKPAGCTAPELLQNNWIMSAIAESTGVWEILNRNVFFVKNVVKRLEAKTSDKFDIYDPNLRELVLECREPELGAFTKVRRLAGGQYDAGSPFDFVVTVAGSGEPVFRISRKIPFVSLSKPPVEVYDGNGVKIAWLKRKFWSLGRTFQVSIQGGVRRFKLRPKGLRGYRIVIQDKEVATVLPKPNGPQADYFADGFAYAVSFADDVPPTDHVRPLVLGFALSSHRIVNYM
jgi:hypothetical protein